MKPQPLPIAAHLARSALLITLACLPLGVAAASDSNYRSADRYNHPAAGFYLGGGAGYNRLNGEDYTGNNSDVDDQRLTYKGFGGFRLNPIVSLEAQYVDFGTNENGDNRVDAHGVTAGAVFEAPLRYVRPYAKALALFWDADSQFSGVRRTESGTDFAYGAGARFVLSPRLDLRAEYERFELNQNRVGNLSATLQFNFGTNRSRSY